MMFKYTMCVCYQISVQNSTLVFWYFLVGFGSWVVFKQLLYFFLVVYTKTEGGRVGPTTKFFCDILPGVRPTTKQFCDFLSAILIY